MTAPQTFHGIVASRPEQTVLDDDRGIIFWVQTDHDPHTDAAQVFLSATRADQVDGVDLGIGSELTIEGSPLGNGVTCATALRPAAHRRSPAVGCWARSRSTSPTWRPRPGSRAPLPAALGGAGWPRWSGWCHRHGEEHRRRQRRFPSSSSSGVRCWSGRPGAPGRSTTASTPHCQHASRPSGPAQHRRAAQAVFDMLGGGLERTGNPWRPMRPRQTGPAYWVAGGGRGAARGRHHAAAAPAQCPRHHHGHSGRRGPPGGPLARTPAPTP